MLKEQGNGAKVTILRMPAQESIDKKLAGSSFGKYFCAC
jgi:hypothetical protein